MDKTLQDRVHDSMISSLAKNFVQSAKEYGFQLIDFVKFANYVFDYGLKGCKRKISAGMDGCIEKQNTGKLPSGKLFLRELTQEDGQHIAKWLEDEEIAKHYLMVESIVPSSFVRSLFQQQDNSRLDRMICLSSERPIGLISYVNIDAVGRSAEMRKMIGERALWGQGLGTEATRLWLHVGFLQLNLHRTYVRTLDVSARNIAVNEKVGFQLEGIQRDQIRWKEKYYDLLWMGILRDEFLRAGASPESLDFVGSDENIICIQNLMRKG